MHDLARFVAAQAPDYAQALVHRHRLRIAMPSRFFTDPLLTSLTENEKTSTLNRLFGSARTLLVLQYGALTPLQGASTIGVQPLDKLLLRGVTGNAKWLNQEARTRTPWYCA
jgi:hypothetical protein